MTGTEKAKSKRSQPARSVVLSLRFQQQQLERLRRLARRLGRTPSETTAILVEEALRRMEFSCIDFRDSPSGRQAYIQGSSLAVWEVAAIAQLYKMDVSKCAEHMDWPTYRVQAALNYAQAFPDEIETALEESAAYDFQTLRRMLPQVEMFTVHEETESGHKPGKETNGLQKVRRAQGKRRKRN